MVFPPPEVVVVGSGLAGLSSALEAVNWGAKVTLLEKEGFIGGNSAKATSGINGVGTRFQRALAVDDSIEMFESDVFKSGGDLNCPSLVRVLASQSSSAIDWLTDVFSLDLSNLSQCGGHSVKRTHREPNRSDGKPSPIGWDIVSKLKTALLARSDVTVLTKCRLLDLQLSPVGVSIQSVRYYNENDEKEYEIKADAVILATGGFGHDWTENSLIREFAPKLEKLATTNGPCATGDGVKIGRKHGFSLVDMDKVQVHPTGFVDINDPDNKVKFLAPESLRAHGAILLNSKGERFANELGPRDYVTNQIFQHCSALGGSANSSTIVSYMILNEKAIVDFGKPAAAFYQSKNLLKVASNLAELSELTGGQISEEKLRSTLNTYNEMAEANSSDPFGKTVFPATFDLDRDVFYLAVITPSIHYTMGGIRVNAAAEIQKEVAPGNFKSVVGLFGAGEVTGGVHGKNRLAGNSLLECVVFGRIAGERAAKILSPLENGLCPEKFLPLQFRERIDVGNETKIFRFNLPSSKSVTGLSCGQYISVQATIDGESIVRYYSPISRPDDYGVIDLLIKVDSNGGKMSHHLNSLKYGDTLEFKGPMGGIQLDFGQPSVLADSQSRKTKIGLICGGTGIAPMIQIIRSIMHHNRTDLDVRLLYGAINEKELAFKDLLEEKARLFPNLKLYFFVEKLVDGDQLKYKKGFIDKAAIAEFMFKPADDVKVILCGPPGMCKAIKPVMTELGYTSDSFYSFM